MDGKKITEAFYVTPYLPTLLILLAIFWASCAKCCVYLFICGVLKVDVFVNGDLFFSSLAITDYYAVTPTFFCIIKTSLLQLEI